MNLNYLGPDRVLHFCLGCPRTLISYLCLPCGWDYRCVSPHLTEAILSEDVDCGYGLILSPKKICYGSMGMCPYMVRLK
jgi:hypothetical protein